MVDVDQFTYGYFNPVFAGVMSTLGCLLGLILAAKARGQRSSVRRRLQIYATLAIAVSGVWIPQLGALLGFGIRTSAVRYEPWTLGASVALPVLLLGAGVWVACLPTPARWRVPVAAPLVGAGVAAANYGTTMSLRIPGTITFDPSTVLASAAGELAAAALLVWAVMATRRLALAVAAALVLGATLTGTAFVAVEGIRVHTSTNHPALVGWTALQLVAPAVTLGAALLAMLWFFTLGASTRHDLRAVFESPENSIEIQPWLLDEVTARVADLLSRADAEAQVALDLTAGTTLAIPAGRHHPSPRRTPRANPTAIPTWRSMPTVGTGQDRPIGTMNGRGRPGRPGSQGNHRLDVDWQEPPPKSTRPPLPITGTEETAGADALETINGAANASLNAAVNTARTATVEVTDERTMPAHKRFRSRNRRG